MSIKQPTSDLNGLTRFANYALIGGGLPAVLLLVADYVVGFKLVPSNQSRVFIAGIAGLFILYGIKWGIHLTQCSHKMLWSPAKASSQEANPDSYCSGCGVGLRSASDSRSCRLEGCHRNEFACGSAWRPLARFLAALTFLFRSREATTHRVYLNEVDTPLSIITSWRASKKDRAERLRTSAEQEPQTGHPCENAQRRAVFCCSVLKGSCGPPIFRASNRWITTQLLLLPLPVHPGRDRYCFPRKSGSLHRAGCSFTSFLINLYCVVIPYYGD